jgi:hypothetical protein
MRLSTPIVAILLLWSIITPASAVSCSQAAALCKGSFGAANPGFTAGCETSRVQCLKTGIFAGPGPGGKTWSNLKKK